MSCSTFAGLGRTFGSLPPQGSHLHGELRTEPFDEHIEAEVDALWRTEVDPALKEVRHAMADHGLVGNFSEPLAMICPALSMAPGSGPALQFSPALFSTSARQSQPQLQLARLSRPRRSKDCADAGREGLRQRHTTSSTRTRSSFVTLRRGRPLVYERNMIDELALRLVHGELPVGS
jgi:hypothetical protein